MVKHVQRMCTMPLTPPLGTQVGWPVEKDGVRCEPCFPSVNANTGTTFSLRRTLSLNRSASRFCSIRRALLKLVSGGAFATTSKRSVSNHPGPIIRSRWTSYAHMIRFRIRVLRKLNRPALSELSPYSAGVPDLLTFIDATSNLGSSAGSGTTTSRNSSPHLTPRLA